MEKNELIQLLERISRGNAGDEDIRWYNDWCNEFQKQEVYIEDFESIKAAMLAEIENKIHRVPTPIWKRHWPRIAAAASIFLVSLAGAYLWIHQSNQQQITAIASQDIAPGDNRAILTLGNGQKIVLDSLQNGPLAGQQGSSISKPQNGLLVYNAADNKPQIVQYNTLTTPRGGDYKLVLPDGTAVWLNAASSIKYPTAFTGAERTVSITGQVYFEVIHNAAKPFKVTVMGQTIEDLGTKFDINAYADEPVVKTTLLDGSVRVVKGEQQVVLKPGQQAIVSNMNNEINVQHADTANTIAWVYGFMSLNNITVDEFMNDLSRWYDVDIVYSGAIPKNKFSGMINRNANLSDVLAVLKASGINTKLEGKKIIVLPL